MRVFTLFLSVFILASCVAKTISDQQRAAYHLQMGNGHLQKGHYPAALGEYLKANELDSENPLIHNQLGLAYFVRGHFDLAEKHFRKATQLNSRFTEAHNNLGRTLIELKKYKEALVELHQAAQDLVYNEPEKTLANLGLAYFESGDYVNAEKYFLEALKLKRKNCPSIVYYGRTLYELNSYEKAAQSLDQAIEQCKSAKIEDPYYYSALSYLKIGQKEQAVQRLENYLIQFPNGLYAGKSKNMLELLK